MERTRTHKNTEAARRGALIRNGKSTAGAVFAALAVLFIFFAACRNDVAPPVNATGRITVSFNIEGLPLSRTESRARTVHPDFTTPPFTKYELTFNATLGGAAHAPVEVTGGSSTSVNLAVGTYTITVTAYTGTDTAVAEGSVSGVVVSAGANTPASVTLGLITGGADGTFSYDITVPAEADTATLTITKLDNTMVNTVDLLTDPSDTISLAPGYYYVRVSLVKGTGGSAEYAGLVETIHIYSGLTSALPAKTYTSADFTEGAAGSGTGSQGVSWAPIDYSDIPVAGYTANLTLTQGGAAKTLSVTGYTNVAWYVDGSSTAAFTTDSIILDGDDYSVKPHSLTVTATKDGVPFARVLAFTVVAGSGSPSGIALADLSDYIVGLPAGTAENPSTVVLAGAFDDYFSTTNIATLKTALDQGKYITLDISGVAFPGNKIPAGNDTHPEEDPGSLGYFGNSYIVGITLPSNITEISASAFAGETFGFRKVTIPASVTTIGNYAFDSSSLTEVTFEAAGVTLSPTSFGGGNDLTALYTVGGAGTYVKSGFTWSKQSS
jgi:hypothetical protein